MSAERAQPSQLDQLKSTRVPVLDAEECQAEVSMTIHRRRLVPWIYMLTSWPQCLSTSRDASTHSVFRYLKDIFVTPAKSTSGFPSGRCLLHSWVVTVLLRIPAENFDSRGDLSGKVVGTSSSG